MTRQRILVFCRAPVAGEVKTRLVPKLGAQGAAVLHEQLVRRTMTAAMAVNNAEVELWCSPDAEHPLFNAFDVEKFPQQGDDLGARMAFALSDALSHRADAAILVGTDCPTMDAGYMASALDRLSDHEAVIGPAEDGGYGLVGMTAPMDFIFSDMTWSTDAVCAETCRRLNARHAYWALMPLIWDVDRPEDVTRYVISTEAERSRRSL